MSKEEDEERGGQQRTLMNTRLWDMWTGSEQQMGDFSVGFCGSAGLMIQPLLMWLDVPVMGEYPSYGWMSQSWMDVPVVDGRPSLWMDVPFLDGHPSQRWMSHSWIKEGEVLCKRLTEVRDSI